MNWAESAHDQGHFVTPTQGLGRQKKSAQLLRGLYVMAVLEDVRTTHATLAGPLVRFGYHATSAAS